MADVREQRHPIHTIEESFVVLGKGFVSHVQNVSLREALSSGLLDGESLAQQLRSVLLRWCVLVYAQQAQRLTVFPHDEAGVRVGEHLSADDVYCGWTFREAVSNEGCWKAHVAWLRGISTLLQQAPRQSTGAASSTPSNDELWAPDATSAGLLDASLSDEVFQRVAARLCEAMSAVDASALGEWLGDAFSRTLRLHPVWDDERQQLVFREEVGSSRRSSGSYYTPGSLVEALLGQTLEPLLDELAQGPAPCEAMLALRICDPSCGAGHFLSAAATRLHRAIVESDVTGSFDEDELWLQIVSRCVYGVDLHPLATWLCRSHLWILSGAELGAGWDALYQHVRLGNSLLGVGCDFAESGIPDDAFRPMVGDDKKVAAALRKRNHLERGSGPLVGSLFGTGDPELLRLAADAWCSAFVVPKRPGDDVVTNDGLRRILEGQAPSASAKKLIQSTAARSRFFHWHLAFPEIFGTEEGRGGFDLIIGNPPWERIKLQDKEYFAARIPAIAQARRASERRQMIEALAASDPAAHDAYIEARREAEATGRLIAMSGLYPLSGRGDTNLYTCFVELSQRLIRPEGSVALLVPSGIATDHTTREYFQTLLATKALVSLYDFENRKRYFPDVSSRFRFCFLHLQGQQRAQTGEAPPRFLFFGQDVGELSPERLASRAFSLLPEQIALLNPNTQTCPIFRSLRDADLTLAVYERIPILWDERSERPPVQFLRMFDMTNDSGLFLTADELFARDGQREHGMILSADGQFLPLYEGKMFDQYDHRFADVVTTANTSRPGQPSLLTAADRSDPHRTVTPQYWVSHQRIEQALGDGWTGEWLLVFKDVTSPTNSRTFIATILPWVAVANSAPLILLPEADGPLAACLCANINSFVLDYIARQKISSLHMNYFIVKQLPFLPLETYEEDCPWARGTTLKEWLVPRVLSLVYTAHELAPFARDCGEDGAPHPWDDAARLAMRSELDAAMFRLYDIKRDDVDYIMETFPIIKKRDIEAYGEYRSKALILSAYDALGVDVVER